MYKDFSAIHVKQHKQNNNSVQIYPLAYQNKKRNPSGIINREFVKERKEFKIYNQHIHDGQRCKRNLYKGTWCQNNSKDKKKQTSLKHLPVLKLFFGSCYFWIETIKLVEVYTSSQYWITLSYKQLSLSIMEGFPLKIPIAHLSMYVFFCLSFKV